MSEIKKVAKNTLIQVIGKVTSTLLGLFAFGLMTRYLGVFYFGYYTSSLAYMQFAGVLADFGLAMVLSQMLSKENADESKITSNVFSFRLLTAVVMIGLFYGISFFLPYAPAVKTGIGIMAVAFLFMTLQNALVGFFQKRLDMIKVVIAENAGRVILVGGVFVTLFYDLGLWGLFWATAAASLINFLTLFVLAQNKARIYLAFDREVWKEIFSKSWPIALTIALNLVYFKLDTVIMSLTRPEIETGLYGATYKVLEILISLPFMFLGLIVPILATAWHSKNKEKCERVLQASFDFMTIIAVPLFFGGLFLSHAIMVLVAGSEFSAAGDILMILLLATAIIFISNVFTHAVVALNLQKKIIWSFAVSALLGAVGYLVFIPIYSYFGAAWVTVVVELQILISSFFIVRKYSGLTVNFKSFFKAVFASLIMSVFIYFANYGLFSRIIGGSVLYFVVMYLIEGLPKDMIKEIIKIKK